MKWDSKPFLNPIDDRFWKIVLVIGLLFHLVVQFTSLIGLDTHLHTTWVLTEIEEGEAYLDWGSTRTVNVDASDPESGHDIGDRYIVWHTWLKVWLGVLGPTTTTIHTASFAMSLLALATVWYTTRSLYGPSPALRLTGLASVYPAFLFAAGRGYPEEWMLLVGALSAFALVKGERARQKGAWPFWWLAGPPLAWLAARTKGVPYWWMLIPLGLLSLWWVTDSLSKKGALPISQNKLFSKSLPILTVTGIGTLLVFGGAMLMRGEGGALGGGLESPFLFVFAMLIALLNVAGIYVLFGMVVWPFLKDWLSGLKHPENGEMMLLNMITVIIISVVTLYVAALWAFEASRLDVGFAGYSWKLGNNARYATPVIIPLHWALFARSIRRNGENTIHDEEKTTCLNQPQTSSSMTEGSECCVCQSEAGEYSVTDMGRGIGQSNHSSLLEDDLTTGPPHSGSLMNLVGNQQTTLLVGLLLLLPISAFTTLHAQTGWTEDAAIQVSTLIHDDEDFLLVSDRTLAMHWLYTMRIHIDPTGKREVTGHWRSTTHNWSMELETQETLENAGNLSKVRWLLLSPEVEDAPPAGWEFESSGKAPFMLGGGIWRLYWRTD